MKSKYRKTKTTVFCCRYHVIFCPKYRRKVLTDPIAKRFK
ncbi:MAG: IS200/IS605 family transposase, partial [Clostridiaceae bacterium]|nr:IS200/IS605 family transposase [Clostridiaceae bacterium]